MCDSTSKIVLGGIFLALLTFIPFVGLMLFVFLGYVPVAKFNDQFNRAECHYTYHSLKEVCGELQCITEATTIVRGLNLTILTGEAIDYCYSYPMSNKTNCYYYETTESDTCTEYQTIVKPKDITGWIVGIVFSSIASLALCGLFAIWEDTCSRVDRDIHENKRRQLLEEERCAREAAEECEKQLREQARREKEHRRLKEKQEKERQLKEEREQRKLGTETTTDLLGGFWPFKAKVPEPDVPPAYDD